MYERAGLVSLHDTNICMY